MPATKFILRPMVPARRQMKPPDLDVTPAFRRWRLRLCPAQPLSTAQYASLEPQFQAYFAFENQQDYGLPYGAGTRKPAIDQSVFHIVGPGEEHFQLLTAFDAGRHAAFFLGRVRSVNSGNRYEFLEDAPVRAQLARIPARPLRRLDSCAGVDGLSSPRFYGALDAQIDERKV
jgi:hypothetical protein